jgi:predicted DsbA family dithiol-disulfide isomerase
VSVVIVEIWSDVACPWCYIGKRRFETALSEFARRDAVEVRWRSFQLDPSLPERYEGTQRDYLVSRKGVDAQRIEAMFDHVTRQAEIEGLGYDFDGVVVANSARALELVHLAAAHGLADAAEERLFSGHFERREDIGDREQLIALGVELGLDGTEVREALEAGRYAAEVRADTEEARRLGITGVPFFVIDRAYGVSGAQPADVFAHALAEAWQASHPPRMVTPAGDGLGAPVCGPDGCPI